MIHAVETETTEVPFDQLPFVDQVSAEARGRAPMEFARWLREDENLEEWQRALSELSRSVQTQITERTAELNRLHAECFNIPDGKQIYFTAKNEFDRWRAGALRFKEGVNTRGQECRQLRRERSDRQDDDKKSGYRQLGAQLAEVSILLATLQNRVSKIETWLSDDPDYPRG